jgi:hypothetical protein
MLLKFKLKSGFALRRCQQQLTDSLLSHDHSPKDQVANRLLKKAIHGLFQQRKAKSVIFTFLHFPSTKTVLENAGPSMARLAAC